MKDYDEERIEALERKQEWNDVVPYVLGAIFPFVFLIIAIATIDRSMGSLIFLFALIVPSVIGGACCVQSFRKSSNGWIKILALLLACVYMVALSLVNFLVRFGELDDSPPSVETVVE